MNQKIIQYINAGYPGIFLVSSEETRVEALLKDATQIEVRIRKMK